MQDDELIRSVIYHVETLDAYYMKWWDRESRRKSGEKDIGKGRRERVVQQARPGIRSGHP